MIDTDTRQLRRNAEGQYVSGAGKIPCDHCGNIMHCAMAPMQTCSVFMPAIPFSVLVGMNRLFNTIRVGKAWTQRLDPGQMIALYEAREKRIFGHARVIGHTSGGITGMLEDHARANHLMLDTPPADAPAILHSWLRQNYGPRIITDQTNLTAIYLLREPDAQRVENGPTA